jgi:hypothetical protein
VINLTDFLLARIAEDEAVARAAVTGGRWRYSDGDSVGAWTLYDEHWNIASLSIYPRDEYDYAARMPAFRPPYYVGPAVNGAHIARHDPARVLAECDAKREVVNFYRAVPEGMQQPYRAGLARALRCLALPYADHPDYDQAWRP